MAGILSRESLSFLFRRDQGEISAKTWWAGLAMLAIVLFVFALGWMTLRPWAGRGLDERAMIDPRTIAAYVYAIIFTFMTILLAVCYLNLSAKRFRARGFAGAWPLGLSGVPLVLLLIWGAAQWLNWRVPESVPAWAVYTAMTLCALAALWHVVELGLRRAVDRQR
ncbi:MAG: hypothetical protein AB7F96_08085 [Beijerinckiaceae bacterium]